MNFLRICEALANDQIPFQVHYPGGEDSKHVVFTVEEQLTNVQLQTITGLGGSMGPDRKIMILSTTEPDEA